MAKELTLMSVGDVFIGYGKELADLPNVTSIWREGLTLSTYLEKIAPTLQEGDLRVGNLEAPLCEGLPPIEGKAGAGGFALRMPPEAADVLKQVGFDAMSLANNHTMNFGGPGMLQTLSNMERVGIVPFGGGRNIREARKPAILERKGVKLALLSYSSTFMPGAFPAGENKPGIATVAVNTSYEVPGNIFYAPGALPHIITTPKRQDRENMEDDVRKARAQADVVIVNWHWGLTRHAISHATGLPIEDCPFFVVNYQEDMGRAAIDAGADLVIGHHPHRLQGMEVYKGKLICYSLATFTWPFSEGVNFSKECVIVKSYIDCEKKQIARITLIPVWVPQDTMQPYRLPIGEAERITAELERLSKKYKTKFPIEGNEIAIKAA